MVQGVQVPQDPEVAQTLQVFKAQALQGPQAPQVAQAQVAQEMFKAQQGDVALGPRRSPMSGYKQTCPMRK